MDKKKKHVTEEELVECRCKVAEATRKYREALRQQKSEEIRCKQDDAE